MKKAVEHRNEAEMRPEYDFASMKGGIRGKHHEEYRKRVNVVLLKPELADAFPTEEAVNEALEGILSTARAVRRTGGLSDGALRSTTARPERRRRS